MKSLFRICFVLCVCVGCMLYAHCQVPCGIYDDERQFRELYEHVRTIEKAKRYINEVPASTTDSLDYNQRTRWIMNKESHATSIQTIMTTYFLSQRVKEQHSDHEKVYKKYKMLLERVHRIIRLAMKTKMTTVPTDDLEKAIHAFEDLYMGD